MVRRRTARKSEGRSTDLRKRIRFWVGEQSLLALMSCAGRFSSQNGTLRVPSSETLDAIGPVFFIVSGDAARRRFLSHQQISSAPC
jgi:hypothetical protein